MISTDYHTDLTFVPKSYKIKKSNKFRQKSSSILKDARGGMAKLLYYNLLSLIRIKFKE